MHTTPRHTSPHTITTTTTTTVTATATATHQPNQMIQRNERRAFEDFCVALQKYPRPLTELGKGQRFVNKRHHNQWSISRAGQYLLAQGAVVHRFRVHYGNIPMEPMLTVVHVHVGRAEKSANMRSGTYFNEQVATAARGTFGRAFEGKGKWSPRLW